MPSIQDHSMSAAPTWPVNRLYFN